MKNTLSPIKIVIADDHHLFIDGFKTLLKKLRVRGVEYVGSAVNGKELFLQTKKLQPDVIFTDIQMPEMNGIAATKIIKSNFPEKKVVALSGFDETNLILDMIEAGASGYLLKNTSKEEIISCIECVIAGKTFYCHETSSKLTALLKQKAQGEAAQKNDVVLSPSEKRIVVLICDGLTNKEIAQRLKLSKRTVENYRQNIIDRLELSNSIELAMYAVKEGIYKP